MKTTATTTVYIALGSNLGHRLAYLREALQRLNQHPKVRVVRASSVYESEAHTLTPQEEHPPYLNAVAELAVSLSPEALLSFCKDLEQSAGRHREQAPRWASRTLDLDLLLYGQVTLQTPTVTVPHPRLGGRLFVLQPWAELAPNLYVPSPYDAKVAALLDACTDPTPIQRTDSLLWDRHVA